MSRAVRDRLFGLFLLAGGGGMVAWTLHDIESNGRFSVKFLVVGCFVAALSPLILITGRPVDPETGKPPLWWNAIAVSLTLLGAAAGAGYSYYVSR